MEDYIESADHSERDRHFVASGPKRVLSLDGGGVRGIISLAYLAMIEDVINERSYSRSRIRLCDYYDLICGVSTGALIAAGLALGRPVAELTEMYIKLAREVFGRSRILGGILAPKFHSQPLTDCIKHVVGAHCLGSSEVKTGLAIVAKRIDTGSVWIFHNNPRGRYYGLVPLHADGNRTIPLFKLLRASTAAPTYFDPELIEIASGQVGAFIDGGVSPHNNPALQALLLTQLHGYGYSWRASPNQLLLTSVGTGSSPTFWGGSSALRQPSSLLAIQSLRTVINDTSDLVQMVLQWVGRCHAPFELDAEVGSLSDDSPSTGKMLTYQRFNVDLRDVSDNQDVDVRARKVIKSSAASLTLDRADSVEELFRLGHIAAAKQVTAATWPSEFDM